MTREEAYDLACTRFEEPALLVMDGECVLGYWVDRKVHARGPLAKEPLILVSKTKGVLLAGRASSWEEAAAQAGLVILPSPVRTKRKKERRT